MKLHKNTHSILCKLQGEYTCFTGLFCWHIEQKILLEVFGKEELRKVKKQYENPIINISPIVASDVITTSGGRDYSGEWDEF